MLEGDLTDFSLPEILQLLGFTRKSGQLRLHGPTAAGRMVLADGHLVDVSSDVARLGVVRRLLGLGYLDVAAIEEVLADTDELPCERHLLTTLVQREVLSYDLAVDLARTQTLDALAELLRWELGSFRFDADPHAGHGIDLDLQMSTDDLLDQARERIAAVDELAARVGTGEQTVRLAWPVPPQEVIVPAEGWGLLPFVDGRRTIQDLAELTGRGAYDIRRVLADLLHRGVVVIGEAHELADGSLGDALARIAAIEVRHHPGAGLDTNHAAGPEDVSDIQRVADRAAMHDVPPTAAPPAESSAASVTPKEAFEAPVPADSSEQAPAGALDGSATNVDDGPGEPQPLRARVRTDRLRPDPTIDEDLVTRLIDGVREL